MNKTEIYTYYSSSADITFIMEETTDKDGKLILQEVKGFYYGEPNEEDTKEFYGKLKAKFEW